MHCKTIISALFALLLAAGPAAAMITIVVPGAPTPSESHAADELGNALQAMTGGRARLWPDLPPWGELEGWRKQEDTFFIVGSTRFSQELKQRCRDAGPEAYVLHPDGKFLYLVGAGDRATLYAIYEYLSQLGCRWLTPGRDGEVIPRLAKLPPFPADQLHQPAYARRDLADFNDIETYQIPWLVRNRVNAAAAQSQLTASWGRLLDSYWDVAGGPFRVEHFGHSYAILVPKGLFPQHPDWFALIDGERRTENLCGYWNGAFATNFCTSNPEAIRHVAQAAMSFFDGHPDYTAFGLTPIDGGHWCECEGCRALDRPPTGHAGRVIALANAVAETVTPKHPDREILVLAYADSYLEPPEGMPIHPNVRVQVCVWPSYLQPMAGPQTEEGRYYLEQLRGWAARKPRLGVWLYQLYSSRTPFDTSIRAMAENLRAYRALGADQVLEECGGAKAWQRIPMLTWCWMQLAWNPGQDWRALVRDFCTHYYGAAGRRVGDLFLRIEDRLEKTGALFTEDVYTAEFVAALRKELARAEREAGTGTHRERVRALRAMLPDPSTYARPLPAGRWYHVAATWSAEGDRGRLRLAVDGKFVAQQEGAWRAWAPAETLFVGRRHVSGGCFSGQLDELRLSSAARAAVDTGAAPEADATTTLLAHYDRVGTLDADLPAGEPGKLARLQQPLSPCRMTAEGRFGACLDVWESPTLRRFDTVAYRSQGILKPEAGTIELWLRPSPRARHVASGHLVDAGGLVFSVAANALKLEAGGLTVTARLGR